MKVGEDEQESGISVNDFTGPVEYVIIAGNGSSVSYTVTVVKGLATPVLNAALCTTSSLRFNWGEVPGATSYEVDVSDNEDFNNSTTYYPSTNHLVVNQGLDPNKTYYYRVRAKSGDLTSPDASGDATTKATDSGEGDIEIYNDDKVNINVGSYDTPDNETVILNISLEPDAFISETNNMISVSTTYGDSPQGLIFTLDFDNVSIVNGKWVISYAGLDKYDPTDVRFTFNGGALTIPTELDIDDTSKTVTIKLSGLTSEGAPNQLLIIFNDESEQTLPVILSTFTAHPMVQGRIRLNWTTQSETGVLGFHALRANANELENSVIVSPLIEATNTSTSTSYSFIDDEVPNNGVYFYWLQIVDIDGSLEHFGPIAVELTTGGELNDQVPLITSLKSPYPNPFNPTVTIPYDLAENGLVKIRVYNTKGQLIRTLVDREESAKSHSILWDGKDESGNSLSTGNYIVKMNVGKYQGTKRVVLLK